MVLRNRQNKVKQLQFENFRKVKLPYIFKPAFSKLISTWVSVQFLRVYPTFVAFCLSFSTFWNLKLEILSYLATFLITISSFFKDIAKKLLNNFELQVSNFSFQKVEIYKQNATTAGYKHKNRMKTRIDIWGSRFKNIWCFQTFSALVLHWKWKKAQNQFFDKKNVILQNLRIIS